MNHRVTNGHGLLYPITAGIAPSSMAFTDELYSSKEKDEAKRKTKEQGIVPSSIASTNEFFTSKEKDEPKKKTKEQPKDKPKRPLSSYNLFFQNERKEILRATPEREGVKPRRSHGKIGFADLARNIAANWKSIDPESRSHFNKLAAKDKERYKSEMDEWKKKQELKKQIAQMNYPAPSADFEPIPIVSPDLQGGRSMMPFSASDILGKGVGVNPLYTAGSQVKAPSPIPIASLASQSSQWAHTFSSAYQPPPISDLASDLDDDCKRLLQTIFHR
jgi:hypothetical protein